jgi:hypothetical protein
MVSRSRRSWSPCSGRSRKTPWKAAFPTKAMTPGRTSRAIASKRSREPAKSAARRSPDPRVVRFAAFVSPMPSAESCLNSCGSSRRGVNPAACRSRQKSFRGLANGAPAAALTRPGLIPQKTTRSPGARTSGTAESVRRLRARVRRDEARAASAAARRRRPARPADALPAGAPSRCPRRNASRSSARSTPPR